jgi:hypothetical protein
MTGLSLKRRHVVVEAVMSKVLIALFVIGLNTITISKYLSLAEQEERMKTIMPGVAASYYFDGCMASINNVCWFKDCSTEIQEMSYKFCDNMANESKFNYKDEE